MVCIDLIHIISNYGDYFLIFKSNEPTHMIAVFGYKKEHLEEAFSPYQESEENNRDNNG